MDTRSRAVSPVLGSPRRRALAAGILGALAALLVVALVAGRGSASARSSGTVTLHKTSLGSILATRSGRTLYLFAADKRGMSACTAAACVQFWPPLAAKGRPTAGKGVRASLLGTNRRPGGVRQVTVCRSPALHLRARQGSRPDKGPGPERLRRQVVGSLRLRPQGRESAGRVLPVVRVVRRLRLLSRRVNGGDGCSAPARSYDRRPPARLVQPPEPTLVRELQILADRDGLTGLPSTRSFEIAITRRFESERPFALRSATLRLAGEA